jgi:hypothetical protein
MREDPSLPPIDRRTLLKIAGAAGLTAPGLSLLQGFSGAGAVAQAAGAVTAATPAMTLGGADVRPPSIPLAVRSPYLSTWLPATSLTGTTPQFWDGSPRGFVGLVLIDGNPYIWAGDPTLTVNGTAVPMMTPTSTEVTATRSIFTATAGNVQLVAEWLSPVEPGNLELQSAPLTLLTVSVSATDGSAHTVQVYADITGEWASSTESAEINWQTTSDSTGRYWTVGLDTPDPLSESDQMADWGQVIWAAAPPLAGQSLTYQSGPSTTVRNQFASHGVLVPGSSDLGPRAINSNQPTFAFAFNFGSISASASSASSASLVIGHARTPLVAYGTSATPLQPLWTQYWPGTTGWQQMTADFITGAPSARQRAIALDQKIQGDASSAAGSGYAAACALALRQCYGGTELAIGPDGTPWLLGKEISSDGDTNTVDIFDQAFLAWLYLDPDLIPLVMAPILDWCASPAWQNAAAWSGISHPYYCVHDLGVYPNPSGRPPGTAPNAGEQMPIEESAGMLIMAAAYANMVGAAAAKTFLSQSQLLWTQWANYLLTQVPTPATQLCTDDWAPGYATTSGSVNLGIKAIIGLAAAAQIAEIIGDSTDAIIWANTATNNVGPWLSLSTDSKAGNYLNLEQGATGTWSCLYNAYYQSVIGLSLVPEQVAADEAAFYLNQLTTYGMPLQSNANNLNKAAWLFYLPSWLSSYPIAADLMSRNVAYINDTSSLVPYGDRYDTSSGVEVTGIEAHPTLGAVFAILAADASPLNTLPAPPAQAPTPPPAPVVTVASAPAPKPKLTLTVSDGGLKLSGKDVSIRIRSSGARCRGELKLVYTHEVTLKNHKRKRENTVIGHVNYSLAPGSTRSYKIKLTAAALKLLKDAKTHKLAVVLDVTVKGGKSVSRHTTIHAPATKRKSSAVR